MINGTNRFSNLSAGVDFLDESATITSSTSSVNDTYKLDESLEYLKEADLHYIGLLETMINIHENNDTILRDLVEYDMMDICEQKTLHESVHSDEHNAERFSYIRENIQKLLIATESAVEMESSIMKDAFDSFATENLKLYDKYLNISDSSIEEGILNKAEFHNITFQTESAVKEKESLVDFNKVLEFVKENTTLESIQENDASIMEHCMELHESYSLSNEDLNRITNFIENGFDSQISMVSENYNTFIHNLHDYVNEKSESVKTLDEDTAVGVFYDLIKNISSAIHESLNKINTYYDLLIREAADYRKSIILCGKYLDGEDIDDATTYMVAESSDIYVFDRFDSRR